MAEALGELSVGIEYSEFQRQWIELARRFGLRVQVPHVVRLGDRALEVPVLLKDFGAARGMLLVTDYDLIAEDADRIVETGYGFSCLSEPQGEPVPDEPPLEMLSDWGWAGSGDPPTWY